MRWWREILLIAALYGAYEVSRGLTHSTLSQALARGSSILHLERSWHIAPEHGLNLALDRWTLPAVVASYLYATLHYLVTPVVLVWLFHSHRGQYRAARTTLAVSTLLGLITFYLLPTAPPRLVAGSHVHDTLALVDRFGWWSGEGSVPRGLGGLTNQFAAMPSLHVGWALWCGVLVARHAGPRWVRALGALYPVLMAFVVLGTGNHYLLDVLAGAAVTSAAGAAVLAGRVLHERYVRDRLS